MSRSPGYQPRNILESVLNGKSYFPDRRWVKLLQSLVGVEIPPSVRWGEHVRFEHRAFGLVIHPSVTVGNRVRLYQGVTLGRADIHREMVGLTPGGGITVEDDVIICANACVLFRSGQTLTIGKGAVVGANAVVLDSIAPHEIWTGIPARQTGRRI